MEFFSILLEKKDKESAVQLVQTHLVNGASDVLSGLKIVGGTGVDAIPDSNRGFEGQSAMDRAG